MSIAARPPRKCTMVGRRDGHFGRLVHLALQKVEIVHLNVLGVAQLARHAQLGRRKVHRLCGIRTGGDGACHRHALQLLKKVEMKKGAAELAVGNGAQPDRFLFLDYLRDMLIFDLAQFLLGQFVIKKICARRQRAGGRSRLPT